MVSVEIDTGTVRRGDRIMVGGHVFTVEDMTALPQGGKRLDFASGESLTMRPTTVLWATRQVDPRRPARVQPR
ncbi:hypothetical protein [Streptomyces sp. NBC_01803]|uniref:hypothetical protein n=1 Tax=Streptomyces sp. NBC_01803 TaxID=2975946 RepID=UPI002DDBCA59|nr:hypothetical protein [Streptomyces sp. NBC_01803]WSA44120.1 hypothetical protein OIE51_07815 [Streptomyces sp. NBC_01803]